MQAKYTLSSGARISIYFWSDYAENKDYRKFSEVRSISPDGKLSKREVKKPLHIDPNRGLYIEWLDKTSKKTEKVYLNEFDHIPYKQLVKKLEEGVAAHDRWIVMEDDILATFMKESDKVCILADLPKVEMVIPFMGICTLGDDTQKVICHLSEERYKKSQWHYKVTLRPDDAFLPYVPSESYYFSDLCSMLRSGIYKLVDEKALEREERKAMKAESQAEADKPFARFVKGFAESMY